MVAKINFWQPGGMCGIFAEKVDYGRWPLEPLVLLTIAGSDPSGGAGIQQDLRVFAQLGCHGMAAIAALTIQNTTGVKGFVSVEPQFLREQVEFLFQDVMPQVVKTGMLGSVENVEVVAQCLQGRGIPLVVDPVLVATSGDPLFEGAKGAFLEHLFPLATVVTPNAHEAGALTGMEVKTLEDMKEAARRLKARGPQWVLIKGGDLEGKEVVDLLYGGDGFHHFAHPRVSLSDKSHGTGCAFASTLAVFLARGLDMIQAYRESLKLVELYLMGAVPLGKGAVPANPLVVGERNRARCRVLDRLARALEILESLEGGGILVPEVQINLCEAIPLARGHQDVAGIRGRVVRWGEKMRAVGCPAFGASRHVANIVLTAMRFDPSVRAAMNVKYKREWISILESSPLEVASFSRAEEPAEVKEREGSTLEWGVNKVCSSLGRVPDIIYDEGDIGKEPMIRVLGRDALNVVEKARIILDMVSGVG
ncbi:MAG: bifunctional hydroxymethylpyrimidine kinase/phosphomethylpyrimidine kinase [Aquificota bacterium]|nr:MAG: bifunctional hydroxymethylpyrimidine kinase/phosphomethylpyrimidine kinase [Aquificota bacterium]